MATAGPARDHAGMTPDPIPWLLEGEEPSVRCLTLTRLLGRAPDAPEVVAARRAVMSTGVVPRILAAQVEDGHWVGRDRFYTAKYRGTVWQLVVLASLGADGGDQRVRAGCEAILRDPQDTESGGFAIAVEDPAIEVALDEMAREEGFLLCPEGAATYAAYKQALADGRVKKSDRVVLFNCASGLKYPLPKIEKKLDRHKPIDYAAL